MLPLRLADTCVFAKRSRAYSPAFSKAPSPKVTGSFAEFLNGSPCLRFSPHLPVSVCSTGASILDSSFFASGESMASYLYFGPHHSSSYGVRYFTVHQTNCLNRLYQQPAPSILLCHCFSQTDVVVSEFQPIVHRLRLSLSA